MRAEPNGLAGRRLNHSAKVSILNVIHTKTINLCSATGNRTPGICVTGRDVTNYTIADEYTLDGIRTRNLWIRSPMRYPLRHKSYAHDMLVSESVSLGLPGFEPGSLDSESKVLTITPQARSGSSKTNDIELASTGNRTRTSCLEGTNSNH